MDDAVTAFDMGFGREAATAFARYLKRTRGRRVAYCDA